MALEIVGSLIKKTPVQSGTSARGEWQKQEFIIKTQDNFPKEVCFNVWGAEKVSELTSYTEGELLKISFNVESREYNGRWYTDLRAWRIERTTPEGDSTYPPAPAQSFSQPKPVATAPQSSEQLPGDLPSDAGEDDLPF
ncbi:MAG: DUF3127 domain-containing protein [Bacteroidales bacterium]|nr:DUF3127 domain-containing protein [Bacteroidales bacterium]